ncbi:MAG: HAMP domain-containing protein, partial [Anaerolineales bacterium]|nr:HAMP domain-containing protein [Anaerolineales bacterium]
LSMLSNIRSAIYNSRHSLRARLALGVAFPVILMLVSMSVLHYSRELRLIEEQMRQTATRIGEVTSGSIRHIMDEPGKGHLKQILADVSETKDISQILLIDLNGRIAVDTTGLSIGERRSKTDTGCIGCHSVPANLAARSIILASPPQTLRIASPIWNEPECHACHDPASEHLGVLLIDMSLLEAREHIQEDLKIEITSSVLFTALVTAAVYLLVDVLVVRRIKDFKDPLEAFASGVFTDRLKVPSPPRDELDALAASVNQMTIELEQHLEEREQQQLLRYHAIVDERERIAREIHDGVAQLMGYVNTKSSAIHLLLQDQKNSEALTQLEQLARSSQDALQELRISILGLRMSDPHEDGFFNSLEIFTDQFSELTGISVDLRLSPCDQFPSLSPEIELHILRIIQEALINVQKHAHVQQAWVYLSANTHILEITIGDDGRGFDIENPSNDGQLHFGLEIMRERAEGIGASFFLGTEPGSGTRVTVRLPLEDR